MQAPAKGIPGAVANTPPEAAQLSATATASGGSPELKSSSSSEVKNYEVSRSVSSTLKPSNIIRKINAAVLVRQPDVIDPETGVTTSQPMSAEDLARIEKLVADAIGIDVERGDSLTVSSAPFMNELLDGVKPQWYEKPFMRAWIYSDHWHCRSGHCTAFDQPDLCPSSCAGHAGNTRW
jgi:flagellar M-ring protein FliF